MKLTAIVPLTLVCIMSGCSFYDVTTLAADAAVGTGLFSDEDRNTDDWNGLWNPDTSDCIRHEKERRKISQRLESRGERQVSVTLPTGEKYSLNSESTNIKPPEGPTATCLARSSE